MCNNIKFINKSLKKSSFVCILLKYILNGL